MRYRLRTLMIVLAVLPPMLAGAWFAFSHYRDERALSMEYERIPLLRSVARATDRQAP